MITRAGIETAYCFLHQKERVYAHSTMDWQRDDIEYAISSFADDMNPELYSLLADGRTDFLRSHTTFHADMLHALDILEKML
uniref:hypothetical protein n=1 Tax=Candidatus Limisoma sp. TaxID=3076476 RepID=UPI0040256727